MLLDRTCCEPSYRKTRTGFSRYTPYTAPSSINLW